MKPARRVFVALEILGLAWALGLALFTSLLFALYLAGAPTAVATLVALVLAAGAVALGARVLWRTPRDVLPAGASAAPVAIAAGLGVAAMQVALAVSYALRAPLVSWDAWAIWALKGRMFAAGGPPRAYFHDPVTAFSHPDYPLNLPLAEGALFRVAGPAGTWLAALLGPACLVALVLLFYVGLSRLYGRALAALASGALALVPELPTQAASGYADLLLAMYAGTAALYLVLWWRFRRPADAVLMGLLAGGAIWTKKEGMIVGALLLLAYAVGEILRRDANRRMHPWTALRPILAAAALPLPWLIFTHLTHPLGGDFLPVTPAVFVANAGRLPHIAHMFALEMLTFERWSFLWIVLAAVVILGARRLSGAGWGLLLLLLGQLLVYMLAYVFSGWQPYTAHVASSLERLLLQTAPLALLLLVETVAAFTARRTDGKRRGLRYQRTAVSANVRQIV